MFSISEFYDTLLALQVSKNTTIQRSVNEISVGLGTLGVMVLLLFIVVLDNAVKYIIYTIHVVLKIIKTSMYDIIILLVCLSLLQSVLFYFLFFYFLFFYFFIFLTNFFNVVTSIGTCLKVLSVKVNKSPLR